MKKSIVNYLSNVGDALSQFVNVAFLFSNDANQCVSSRAYTNKDNKYWHVVCVSIDKFYSFFGVNDHCKKAYNNDVSKASDYLREHKYHKE